MANPTPPEGQREAAVARLAPVIIFIVLGFAHARGHAGSARRRTDQLRRLCQRGQRRLDQINCRCARNPKRTGRWT
jgi:hypothetical protein